MTIGPAGSIVGTFLGKCTTNPVFPQANDGAVEAAGELESEPTELVGPADCADTTAGIDIVTNAVTQQVDVIMVSNNAGDQLGPAAAAAQEAGIPVVTWDSPIPSAEGESVYIAPADLSGAGQVMAEMARSILGEEGGQMAILSATPEAANQNIWIASLEELLATPEYENIELVDTVYGNDVPQDSQDRAEELLENPDLDLIMAPTTVGIVAAAQVVTQADECDRVKVSGLGVSTEMRDYTLSGCAPEFALWSFPDLGYLSYYVGYGLATGQIEAEAGQQFEAGRLGEYTIDEDPGRDAGLRVLLGPIKKFNADNIDS